MNAKRWFYLLLLLPIVVPLAFCLYGHLYYHLADDPGFTFGIKSGFAYHESPNFSGKYGSVGLWNNAIDYLTLPAAHIFSNSLMGIAVILPIHYALLQYLIFLALVGWWAKKQPVKVVLRKVWKFPLYFLVIFWLGLPLIESGSLRGILWFGTMATLPVLIFSYLYIGLAFLIIPKRYLYHAPPR